MVGLGGFCLALPIRSQAGRKLRGDVWGLAAMRLAVELGGAVARRSANQERNPGEPKKDIVDDIARADMRRAGVTLERCASERQPGAEEQSPWFPAQYAGHV
jgi:hypothetical protein